MIDTFVHGYALIIGVGTCSYSPWSLPVTVKDGQALRSILLDPFLCAYKNDNDHIQFIHDEYATKANILKGLEWLKRQAASDKEATVIIYYSGHGWLDSLTNHYYLIPYDVSPFDIPSSALSSDEFTNGLRQIQAQRLLVIIDSCHAEGMATSKDNFLTQIPSNFKLVSLTKEVLTELKQSRGRAVFTSSSGEQKSWIRPDNSMSIYTYHLIEALKGAANRENDTFVRLSNLMNYINEAVPKSTLKLYQAEQTPFFDMTAEDFPVAMLRGGKGLNIKSENNTSKLLTRKRGIIEGALEMALQSLAILERQAAGYGDLERPAHLELELNAKRGEVAILEKKLNDLLE